MKKFLFFLFFLGLGAALFVWVITNINLEEAKEAFFNFGVWQGIVIFCLTAAIITVESLKWREVLKGQKIKVPFFGLWKIHFAGYSIRYFTSTLLLAGDVARGYFLQKRYNVLSAKSAASIFIDRSINLAIDLFFIFSGFFFFLFTPRIREFFYNSADIGISFRTLFIILAIVVLVFTAGIAFFFFRSFRSESIAKFFLKIFKRGQNNTEDRILQIEEEIFRFFRFNNIFLWKGLALSLLRGALFCGRGWLLVIFLGKAITFLPAFSLFAFALVSALIPIPAQLGSHEAIQLLGFSALGLGAATGTVFAIIIRGIEIIIALIGLMVLLYLSLELLKSFFFKLARLRT